MAEQNHSEALPPRIAHLVRSFEGFTGVALGGSRAQGTADGSSDYDIGLYYDPVARPAFKQVLSAIEAAADPGAELVPGGYDEWGPWINGGALARIDGRKVDILLRDLTRVEAVLADCRQGRFEVAYQPGHPHAFVSVIYAAEIHHAVPLHDPAGVLAEFKEFTVPYPAPLASSLIEHFGWEARFSLETARTAIRRGDIAYVVGAGFRAVACLTQVLFALNHTYLMNEKGAVAATAGLSKKPKAFGTRAAQALAVHSLSPADLTACLDDLQRLHVETQALVDGRQHE